MTTLHLWSDSCGGQNRNIKIVLGLKKILAKSSHLQQIFLNYLIPGHSYLPNDTDFGKIEGALKYCQRLYDPKDYMQVMRTAREQKPFIVKEVTSFFGTKQLQASIVNRKTGNDGTPVGWLKTRKIWMLKEKPGVLLMDHIGDGKDFVAVDIRKYKKKGRKKASLFKNADFEPAWESGKPIPAPKLKDVKSMLHLIPAASRAFFKKLTTNGAEESDSASSCSSDEE